MSEKDSAPGELVLIEALVNTLDIETGADTLDTADGRAAFGLTERDVPEARELREALRTACLAHAGHRPPGDAAPCSTGCSPGRRCVSPWTRRARPHCAPPPNRPG